MARAWNDRGGYWYDPDNYDANGNNVIVDPGYNWLRSTVTNGPMEMRNANTFVNGLLDRGITTDQLNRALTAQGYQSTNRYGADGNTVVSSDFLDDPNLGWQGVDSLIRNLGTGLQSQGINTDWQNYYNQGREQQQQRQIADQWSQQRDAYGRVSGDFADLGDILTGVGLVAGIGGFMNGGFGNLFGNGGVSNLISDGPMLDTALGGGGGVGSAVTSIPATGGGSGGNMSWLDDLLNLNSGDLPAMNGDPLVDLGVYADGTGGMNQGVIGNGSYNVNLNNLGDGITLPEGTTSTPNNLTTAQGIRQELIDRGFMSAVDAQNLNTSQIMNAGRLLGALGGSGSAGGSALSRILGGSSSSGDWTSLLGLLGTGALSAFSANQNSNALRDIADRSWNAGEPYRNRLADTYTNPGGYLDSPEVRAVLDRSQQSMGRALSARDGNPVGSGRALTEMNDYAGQTMMGQLGNYRQQLANFGGQSALTGSYSQLGSNAADASSNIYNSLANTVSRVTQPQNDMSNLLRMYGGANGLA